MDITFERIEDTVTAIVNGKIDTMSSPEFEQLMTEELDETVTELILDITDVDYISSAGLRVLLALQKQMDKQGKMSIRGASPDVYEVLFVTGFTDVLTIEE